MSTRTLIFYGTAGPDQDDAAWRPFTLARRAVDAGLDCAVMLAGPATGLMREEVLSRIEGRPAEAWKVVADADVPVWLSPG